MSIPVRTLTVLTGLGLTGVGGYYYLNTEDNKIKTKVKNEPEPIQPKYHDPRPFRLLDNKTIDNILCSGQFANVVNNKNIKNTYTNRLASNNPVEDNYSIHTFEDGLIAGVYDGHIGPSCSRLIRHQLPVYMAREISNNKKDSIENKISSAFVLLDQDIQQRFYNLFPKNLRNTTEKDIQLAVQSHPDPAAADAIIKEAIHGSCACTVYIKEGVVYAANTGDSRVVIVSQDENGQWKGRRLVEEESPANPEWRAHLLSQHPIDETHNIIFRNRIFGLIAVGGSFGDIMYKVPLEYQFKVLPYLPYEIYRTFSRYHHRIIVNYRTPPYLESKPLVSRHTLTKEDRYIILGTDGLWDELSWDNVRSREGDDRAAEIMSRWPNSTDSNPATHLLRQALLYQAVYKNVGVMDRVEDPGLELSKRLTRQPSRNFRDDITITVIELQTSQEEARLDQVGPVSAPTQVEIDTPYLVDPAYRQKSSWLSWFWPSKL